MKIISKVVLIILFLLPTNIYAENTALDSAIYEVMYIGFMLPPADFKWQDTSARANYKDIKTKIRKYLHDAILLNHKYPNIAKNQKNNMLFRYDQLHAELQDNIKNNQLNKTEQKLYTLFINMSLLAINEYKNNIENMVAFDESDFYISLRCRIILSYILFHINYLPYEQKIILEYTSMYIEKYKDYMQNDLKKKVTSHDYYNTYKKAVSELLKAVDDKYNLNSVVNLALIKDNNNNSLKGKWYSIDFDKANNPIYTTFYSLFFGGYKGYHYYNFSSKNNFVETFYINKGKRQLLLLYPKTAYIENNIIYVTLENDPLNNANYTKPLYLQAKFKNKDMIEIVDSYYDGVSLLVNNMDNYIKNYKIKLDINHKIKKDNIERNVANYIHSVDKYADISSVGVYNIAGKTFYVFISYYQNACNYDGVNNQWSNIIISFWEDNETMLSLKDYTYLDDGGVFDKCNANNNIISCSFKYEDYRKAYGVNTYQYIFSGDKFYLYSYSNITGIDNQKTSCTYYTYNIDNKKLLNTLSLNFLTSLREKAYYERKCNKIVGIE